MLPYDKHIVGVFMHDMMHLPRSLEVLSNAQLRSS